MNKKILIIQLRPEDETADNEFEAFLKYGGLKASQVERIRAEQAPLPVVDLGHYAGIIVGGSPYDVSKPEEEKSETQKRVERDFEKLLTKVVEADFPFLGACSGMGFLGNFCKTPISGKFSEDVGGVDITLTEEGKKDPLLKTSRRPSVPSLATKRPVMKHQKAQHSWQAQKPARFRCSGLARMSMLPSFTQKQIHKALRCEYASTKTLATFHQKRPRT